jgi:hypothetical protein
VGPVVVWGNTGRPFLLRTSKKVAIPTVADLPSGYMDRLTIPKKNYQKVLW